MLDLEKDCPALLAKIDGFPKDGRGTAIEKIRNDGIENHRRLAELIGFPEGTHRITEIVSTRDLFSAPVTVQYMRTVLGNIIGNKFTNAELENFIFNNALPDKRKVSRILSNVTGYTKEIYSAYVEIILDIVREKGVPMEDAPCTIRLSILNELRGVKLDSPTSVATSLPLIVQNFYSELAKSESLSVGISYDYLDFLQCCNSPLFSSCFSIDRWNNSGAATVLALSSSTLCVFVVDDKGDVQGRAWIIFNPENTQFYVCKIYGFIDKLLVIKVACWLMQSLPGDWGYVTSVNMSNNIAYDNEMEFSDEYVMNSDISNNIMYSSGFYADPYLLLASCEKERDGYFFGSTYYLHDNVDIFTGKTNNYSIFYSISNNPIPIVKCKRCGKAVYVNATGMDVCSDCIKKYYKKCDKCGEYYDTATCKCSVTSSVCVICGGTAELRIGDTPVCDECINALYKSSCEACGRHIPGAKPMSTETNVYKGHLLCTQCYQYVNTQDVQYRDSYKHRLLDQAEQDDRDTYLKYFNFLDNLMYDEEDDSGKSN